MKQKDIAVIIIVVFVSGVLSYFVSNAIFASPESLQTEVEVIDPITADFPQPDERYFNPNSINPTQTITIGDGQNQQPFQADN
jgi:hypothetical protein